MRDVGLHLFSEQNSFTDRFARKFFVYDRDFRITSHHMEKTEAGVKGPCIREIVTK